MRTYSLRTIIVTALFILSFVYVASLSQAREDPVLTLLNEYNLAVEEYRKQEDHSQGTTMLFHKNWQERFLKVVNENPNSQYVESARGELLGLTNSLGEFDKSQQQLNEVISRTTAPEEKIRLLNELGEICRARYLDTQDINEARKSFKSFEQAHLLYLQLPSESLNGNISGRQVVFRSMAGDISKVFKDHQKTAVLFQTARELFQDSTESAMTAVMMGYDLETIAHQEMIEWIHAEAESKALNSLTILSKLHPHRWPPSFYALDYAQLWYEGNPRGFQNFVEKWLNSNVFDERTPILMARLGFSYFDHQLYEKALPIYEVLRDKHRADFQKLEPDAFREGNSGHYDRILSDLAMIYLRLGHTEEAKKIQEELKEVLPKSDNIEGLSKSIPTPRPIVPIQPRSSVYVAIRITFIVAGLIMILWGVYLRWGK